MKKSLLFLLCFLILTLPAMAGPFPDAANGEHWAYDAINLLQEKGLVEGYPDGLFKGDRPVTRYEMAMVIARVIAKLEQLQASIPKSPDLSPYFTKDDLQLVNKLLKEYKTELDSLGIRVTNIEDSLNKLTGRVESLEKVFVAGDMTVVATGIGFTKEPYNPDPNNVPFAIEDYGYYVLTEGMALTSRINLDVGVNVNENVVAGGTLTGYSSFGDPQVAYSWGVIPPYNPEGYSFGKIYNNGFNFQTSLNKLWFNTKGDWTVNGTLGEYYPQNLSPLVYYGIVAAPYWAPTTFPLYGLNFNGNLYENYKFEILQANDLTWCDYGPNHLWNPDLINFDPYNLVDSDYYKNPEGYHSRMYGAMGGYENDKLNFDVTYMRIYEDRASRPTSTLNPRDEILLGFKGSYKAIDDRLKIFGEFSQSWFSNNLITITSRATGNACVFGGEGTYTGFDYKGQFIRVEGNYEPFNFHQIFEFTPEAIYIPSLYRNNRIGFNGRLGYNFEEKGRVDFGITYFNQIDPTLDTNPATTIGNDAGFQDHAFVNNSTNKGRELFFDVGGNYQVTDSFRIDSRYYSFNFNRLYPTYTHDQTRRFFHLQGTYNITEKFSAAGIYDFANISGLDDFGINTDRFLNIPGINLTYNFDENTSLNLAYRYYNNDDKVAIPLSYTANRVSTWMTMKF